MSESDDAAKRPRRSVARTAGLAGAVLGFAAAGVAAGVALERYVVGRGRSVPDPYAHEPFGELPADETRTVAINGSGAEQSSTEHEQVDLHVEIVEPTGGRPDLTVVFVHGFCLDMGTFHFQRRRLAELDDPRVRMVFYDQPGHGQSGRLAAGEYSLTALGDGLLQVIAEVAPRGPLVLVGHSMGGMTIMALAEQQPELFAERVVGVSLISSSAGGLDKVNFGLPELLAKVRRPLMPVLTSVNRLSPTMIDRARRVSSDLAWLLTRRYGFGGESPSPALVSYVEQMNSTTSVDVIVAYVRTIFEHLRYDALANLLGIETLVIAGDKDLITPLEHSEEICRLLPGAELVVVENGGHVALLEFHEQVSDELVEFLGRAARASAAAAPPLSLSGRRTRKPRKRLADRWSRLRGKQRKPAKRPDDASYPEQEAQ
ncbi:MAG: alpha/beta fold hydrolase [Micromonosporaceae bacterium]